MRPKKNSYTLAALNATGYVSNATGATWTLDATAGPADGLAHQVTIHGDAATDHSAKTAVITGTDAEGRALTETVNLPNGVATVTSTKYFKTVTSVVPSATIGVDTMDVGWNAVSVTPAFIVNNNKAPYVNVDIGGTVTFTVQQTADNVFTGNGSTLWLTAGTASQTADYGTAATEGCSAVRVQVASHTSGTLAIAYSQSSVL